MLIRRTSEVPPDYLRSLDSPKNLLTLPMVERLLGGRSSCTDPDASRHQLAPTFLFIYG